MVASGITSNDFLTRHSSANPTPQRIQRKLCCTCQPCRNVFTSWRDGVMVALEGGTAAAGAVSLLFYGTPLAVCLFTLSGLSCTVHICWRRDAHVADMSRLADQLGEDDVELGKTIVKVQQTEKQIQMDFKIAQQDKIALSTENQELLMTERDTSAQVSQLQRTDQSLEETNKRLEIQISTLQSQIKQLKMLLAALREHFRHLSEQNEKLKDNIEGFSGQVSRMGSIEINLKKALEGADEELQSEASKLAAQITASQSSSAEIFDQLAQKNRDFASEIQTVKAVIAEYERTDQDIAQKSKRLQELEKQTQQIQEQLEKVHKEFSEESERLERTKKELSVQTGQLGSIEHSFEADLIQLDHTRLDLSSSASRFETNVNRLAEILKASDEASKSTEQQSKEIQDL